MTDDTLRIDATSEKHDLERDQPLEALTNEQFLELVGNRVRRHRMKIGMSRKMLAKKSGVSERYLAQLESGQGNMSIKLLRKVTLAIGLKMNQLMAEREIEDTERLT